MAMKASTPRVAVLLATFNGIKFIAEQMDSIRGQVDCTVDIWISDDQSTDGTWEWLSEASKNDPQCFLLPSAGRFGRAAKNFYRLLSDVDLTGYDYVALSDQDDVWFADKLSVSIVQMSARGAHALSSNVVALWPDGRKRLIDKSQSQRRLDYLFESAGPGCTYVLTAECATDFQRFLAANRASVDTVQFHDWMLYAWARSEGHVWHIDSAPTMYYRQHEKNEFGANIGWSALRKRIFQVRSGWYREQILAIARLVAGGATFNQECATTIRLVRGRSFFSRGALMMKVSQLRRSWRDRVWLVAACLAGGV